MPTVAPQRPTAPSPFPGPPPDDATLATLAAARPELAWEPTWNLDKALNAHYANTRHQVAYALARDYNSLEGDVRLRDGKAVMVHDRSARPELTFDQWARLGATSQRMMRIDIKEREALAPVVDTLRALNVPAGRVQFNVSALAPWLDSNQSIEGLKALRTAFPDAWITFNIPVPTEVGHRLVMHAGKAVGGRVGVSVQAPLARASHIAEFRNSGLTVNAWNLPQAWQPADIAKETARLRALGVNGMIDLRRRDDPLAYP